MSTCPECRQHLSSTDIICPGCGTAVVPAFKSQKSPLIAFILCLFFGCFGLHRFYTGKIKSGFIMLITLGAAGIWTLIDLITIAASRFKDQSGHTLIFARSQHSLPKTLLFIIGSIAATAAYYAMIFYTVMYILTSPFVNVAKDQLKALRDGDLTLAYSYMADEKFSNVSFDAFKSYIQEHPAMINNSGASFDIRKYEDNQAYAKGELSTINGSKYSLEYMMIKVDDAWKITGLRLRPIAASTSSELVTYTDPNQMYTIEYPGDWTHETAGNATVLFSGPEGSASFATAITIQPISTKGVAAKEDPVNLVMTDLKNQINQQATNQSFSDIKDVTLPSNPEIHGKTMTANYTYKGQEMRKMQYLFLNKDKTMLYSWSFTSPKDQFDNDLNTANEMIKSWDIK